MLWLFPILGGIVLLAWNIAQFVPSLRHKKSSKYTLGHWCHNRTWQNARRWLASLLRDPWYNIAMALFIALLPMPWDRKGEKSPHALLESTLAKFGLYYIFIVLFLGPPHFDIDDRSLDGHVNAFAIVAFFLFIYLGSRFITR